MDIFSGLDSTFSEEEKVLHEKYALIKKTLKLLEHHDNKEKLNFVSPSQDASNSEAIEDAKRAATNLVKSGIIDLKSNIKENQGFKRSHNLKRKVSHVIEDIKEKTTILNTPNITQPKLSDLNYKIPLTSNDEKLRNDISSELLNLENISSKKEFIDSLNLKAPLQNPSNYIPKRKNIFPPNNTIYITSRKGKLTQNILDKFNKYGKIIRQNFQPDNNRAFITLESIQIAETAIKEMNGLNLEDNMQLIVSYARHNSINTSVNTQKNNIKLKNSDYDLDKSNPQINSDIAIDTIPTDNAETVSYKGKKFTNLWSFSSIDEEPNQKQHKTWQSNDEYSLDSVKAKDNNLPQHVTLFGEAENATNDYAKNLTQNSAPSKPYNKGPNPQQARSLVTYAEEDLFDSD